MANTQRANPADRFGTPASVAKWHLTRRLLRGRGYRPDNDETADSLALAFRLEPARPAAGEKPKASPAGKSAS